MLIRHFIPYTIFLLATILAAQCVPYLTIWHMVDYRRWGAFPEEDHVTLAYVLGGNFMTRLLFMQHFKTILKYSDSFFRLHLITDKENREDIHTLLTTWNVSNCAWWFHDLEKYEERVKWIPNSHYSKYYGLSKLLIPEIISDKVGKIMYVDIDIIFRADIFYLWQKFRDFNSSQCLGMIENMSDWYLNKEGKKRVWPALGRGFNAGIIMMDLDKLRDGKFNEEWREIANKYLRIHGKTTMSDQDIFNAYIHDYPDQIKALPCEYNYQLGSLTRSEELCKENPLGLHFNSQNKTVRKSYLLYNEIRKEVDGIDGTDLRRKKKRSLRKTIHDFCESYIPAQDFRVLPNALGRMEHTAELCLVTQFSTDRLESFLDNLKTWEHPVSAAVYGKDGDLIKVSERIKSLNRKDVALHMVFESEDSPYPINFLRNVAVNYSNCENLLLADVDFMVYADYEKLLEEVKTLDEKDVLVVPAFEAVDEKINDVELFPKDKDSVVEDIIEGKFQTFREKIWPSAHHATNISEWMNADDVYTVSYEKNYEPYFVIKNASCPVYDQRFGGFGWNKVTHVMQLKSMDFTFKVSPSSFMIHKNHSASLSLTHWRSDANYKKCMKKLKQEFEEEIQKKLALIENE